MGRMEGPGGNEDLLAMWDSACIYEELLCFVFARRDSDEANCMMGSEVDGDDCTKLTGSNAAAILLLMDHNPVLLRMKS